VIQFFVGQLTGILELSRPQPTNSCKRTVGWWFWRVILILEDPSCGCKSNWHTQYTEIINDYHYPWPGSLHSLTISKRFLNRFYFHSVPLINAVLQKIMADLRPSPMLLFWAKVTSSALCLAPAVMTMRKNAPSMPPAKPMAAGHIADFMLANDAWWEWWGNEGNWGRCRRAFDQHIFIISYTYIYIYIIYTIYERFLGKSVWIKKIWWIKKRCAKDTQKLCQEPFYRSRSYKAEQHWLKSHHFSMKGVKKIGAFNCWCVSAMGISTW